MVNHIDWPDICSSPINLLVLHAWSSINTTTKEDLELIEHLFLDMKVVQIKDLLTTGLKLL